MPSKEISDQQASPDSSKDTLRGAHPAEVRLSEPVGVRQQPADCFFGSAAAGEKSLASGYNMFPTDPHYKAE